jgi:hypothetical protein
MAGCCGGVSYSKSLNTNVCGVLKKKYLPGDVFSYNITLKNPTTVSETVKVEDAAPRVGIFSSIVVTKIVTGGATGATGTALPLNDTVTLPANSSVVYTITATVAGNPDPCPAVWTNVARISKNAGACNQEIHDLVGCTIVVTDNAKDNYTLVFGADAFGDHAFENGNRTGDHTQLLWALLGGQDRRALEKLMDFAENKGTLAQLIPVGL